MSAASTTKKPTTTKKTASLKKNQTISMTGPGAGRGGAGRGQGRKKGVPNKRTQMMQDMVAASGETPLEFMLKIMRGEAVPKDADPAVKAVYAGLQFEAAKACAPYIHARLSSVEVAAPASGKDDKEKAELSNDPIEAAKQYKEMMGG